MNFTETTKVTEYYSNSTIKINYIDECIPYALRQSIKCFLHFVVCFGLVGNLISFYIFVNFSRNRSINILIAAYSIADSGTCAIRVALLFFQPSGKGLLNNILLLRRICQFASTYMLVLISIDRYLAICHPFLVQRYCTGKRAKFAVMIVVAWATLIPTIYIATFRYTKAYGLSRWIFDVVYAVYLFFMSIFPTFVLSVTNYMVARAILSTARIAVSSRERREYNTAKMMLYVVIVFIISHFLNYVFVVLIPFVDNYNTNILTKHVGQLGHHMYPINSASTCIFYYCYSTRYRERLHQLFGAKNADQRKASSVSSTTTSFRMSRRKSRTSFASHREVPNQAKRLLDNTTNTSK